MRVAIDGSALGSGRGGDETLLRGLLRGLAEAAPEDGAIGFPLLLRHATPAPDELVGDRRFPVRRLEGGPAAVRFAVRLPRALLRERSRPDLLYTQTHAPPLSPVPVALQLTDLSFRHHPEFYPWRTRLRLNVLIPLQARAARLVLTISDYSRRDLLATYHLPPERVVTVPCAVVPRPRPAPMTNEERAAWAAGLGIDGPFFLYVGNLHPRKNVPRLVEAFVRARGACPDLAEHRLVLVGASWWGSDDAARSARRAPPGTVVMLGRVGDDDRDRLMQAAVALCYPSYFEGFGLPPVEAMAMGTPVLASNTSSMPEVLGDAALLVGPRDTDGMARELVRLGTDEGLRATLRERGPGRAARYAPRAIGELALDAFRSAIEVGTSRGRSRMRGGVPSDQSASTPGSSPIRSSRRQKEEIARTRTAIVSPPFAGSSSQESGRR
jgi:glycosyltransferase involved in cell wall biosynthesis